MINYKVRKFPSIKCLWTSIQKCLTQNNQAKKSHLSGIKIFLNVIYIHAEIINVQLLHENYTADLPVTPSETSQKRRHQGVVKLRILLLILFFFPPLHWKFLKLERGESLQKSGNLKGKRCYGFCFHEFFGLGEDGK